MFLAVFAGVWLGLLVRGIVVDVRGEGQFPWFRGLMGLLTAVGAGGFFATGLAAWNTLQLPNSFEWPAGRVSGVVRTPDGKSVVPLEPPGRIQLYDAQWNFMRGWHVEAAGGAFQVECMPSGTIEVRTARLRRHYSFTQDGVLISNEKSADSNAYPRQSAGQTVDVPTSSLLWVFSSPLGSWGLAATGMIGMAVAKAVRKRVRLLEERTLL